MLESESSLPAISAPDLSAILRQLIDAITNIPEDATGLETIYQQALVSLKIATGVERASILLFDPDGVMRFKAWLGLSDKYRKSVEGHTPWSQEDVNPAPIVTYDIFEDKELTPYYPVFSAEGMRGLAFIPLLYRSKVIGKFMLYSRVPYHFKQEIESAVAIAHLVAYAVIRRKIEEKLKLSETNLENSLQKEMAARLEAEKSIILRDDFISITSHELRSPLTPILLNFQLTRRCLNSISDKIPQVQFVMNLFEKTEQQFNRYLRLVENLLDASRISAERLILKKELVNISALVRELIERHQVEFKNLGYAVDVEIDDEIICLCDKIRIEQVFNNMISNAIKYGLNKPLHMTLQLKAGENGVSQIEFEVVDQGIGISKENQKKIFERFERAANLINYGGLGLGLYISRNILKAHGGDITVKSDEGLGSTFTAWLPLGSDLLQH
ncbi:MAG: GAF domain-containing sensor histidine kinase [Pseudobdellovibrio sp.]|nr:GAF domain-containing sensor histidine kinase [Pseudobdellovibrio sp.]